VAIAGSGALPAHRAAWAAPQQLMPTSADYTNLQQLSPETTGTLGAGTISSRSRPATGVVLLEEVQETGDKNTPTVSAEIVLDGGVAATVTWAAEYPLNRGMFYDVETRAKTGEGAFLQVAPLPNGKSIADVSDSFFTKAVFATEGRFGAYGAPTDIRVLSSSRGAGPRLLELSFAALSPGQTEVPRRALVAAVQPDGASDVVMLVGGATTAQWKKAEPSLRRMASSLRIARTRPTSIQRKKASDYRFEEQGGLKPKTGDVNEIF
jgi:hypothetical protein